MNNEIISKFKELKLCGQRYSTSKCEKEHADKSVAVYLERILESGKVSDFENVGFCYWNISDSYALLRDGEMLYRNHIKFYEHILSGDRRYLYWPVCDATQRLMLENSGNKEFWWAVYREATAGPCDDSVIFAEFLAHRAALYYSDSWAMSDFECAKSKLEDFLVRTKCCEEYTFYKVNYLSLISRFIGVDRDELSATAHNLLCGLSLPQEPQTSLPGQWKSVSVPFGRRRLSEIGVNAAINSLIYSKDISAAESLYSAGLSAGLKRNAYIESRLKQTTHQN